MKINKNKVFEVLQTCYFLNKIGTIAVSDDLITIWDTDNELLANCWYSNGELKLKFPDTRSYTSEQLKDYLDLLVDLKKCLE